MTFNEAKSSVYKYDPVINQKFEKDKPIFSVFICCYYNLDYIRQSIQSVLDQDYINIELILVDNGAHLDVREYLREFYKNSTNTALVTFEVNQFEWSDTEKGVAICWNVALLHAKGDYISHLGYDDLFSSSYASRMVNLFLENPACVTAAPMPYSINSLGEVDKQSGLRDLNTRDRYTDGMDIAIDLIEGQPKKLFAAPGEIFAIRRDILLKYGGYDRIVDISQVLKYAILGVSGFDSEAVLYWRHHNKQLNRQSKSKGVIFYRSSKKGWDESGIVELWQERFDAAKIKSIIAFKRESLVSTVFIILKENMRSKNARGLMMSMLNIGMECPKLLPQGIYVVARELLSMVFEWLYRRLKFYKGRV